MQPQIRVIDEIEARLRAAFTVTELQVEDESESHRGHAGWREGGRRISTSASARRNWTASRASPGTGPCTARSAPIWSAASTPCA
jgi:hypothetical protein